MDNLNSNNNNGVSSVPVRKEWSLTPSKMAQGVLNPIRRIVDGMTISPNPDKDLIRLTIGDPSVFGNLDPAKECVDAVVEAARSGAFNGYPSSIGSESARQAVADYSTDMGVPVTAQDVILTSGCSESLELVIGLLANPGQNVLIPRPGFPLYTTLANAVGVSTKHYELKPEEEWDVDLQSLEDAIDADTAAVIMNSPSNPCGGVFSKQHVQDIIDICARYRVPIISDDVYEHVVYNNAEHHSFAEMSKTVPIFAVSSISKRFLVPGWRLGWVIVHDRQGAITPLMRKSLVSLTQRTLGPSSLLQGALPAILSQCPQSSFDHTKHLLEENARVFFDLLSNMKGLVPIKPSGAMYMMVKIDLEFFPDFDSDIQFTERLMTEESIFCLPASCFSYPGYLRIVLSVPQDKAIEACGRMALFCDRHYLNEIPTPLNENGSPIIPLHSKGQAFSRISSSCYLTAMNNNRK